MSVKLYELAGASETCRFSPYCWRIKYALAHKNIDAETDIIRFTNKSAIDHCETKTVPVLDDGDKTIADSFQIALYLDQAYPDNPLMGSDIAIGQARFIESWANSQIMPLVFRMIILDIFEGLAEEDKGYFRETREKRFGKKLEDIFKYDDEQKAALAAALTPLRLTLTHQPFLSGEKPGYADYILIGIFMFARTASDKVILAEDDKIHPWLDRMLDLYGGLGRNIQNS